ncbi:hypothetical protein ES705_23105 [subsurface metagenome]
MEDKEAIEQLGAIVAKDIGRLERFCTMSPKDNLLEDIEKELIILQDLLCWLRDKWRLVDKH